MVDTHDSSGNLSDDMAEYLQTFLDETDEQLDDLVETLLVLEGDSSQQSELNEAFRLIHSIKGSAGMMGLDNIAQLAHHLENRFERFREGAGRLDESTMNVVLQCIDFFRACNSRLRDGTPLEDAQHLMHQLQRAESTQAIESKPHSASSTATSENTTPRRVTITFRPGLQLVDLKAQLILRRVSELGEVVAVRPEPSRLVDSSETTKFAIEVVTPADDDALRSAVNVDGVDAIAVDAASAAPPEPSQAPGESAAEPERQSQAEPAPNLTETLTTTAGEAQQALTEKAATKMGPSMRVDIERLDHLMNLAGELVVNRAQFLQFASQIRPAIKQASALQGLRELGENLRRLVQGLQNGEDLGNRLGQIQQLQTGVELLDEQVTFLEHGRRCLGGFDEALDQLSRVSNQLQRSVLDTRMLPVGPLFNRFKRVIRDLSQEHGKEVELRIQGEKTELDKRMIDDLFEPLLHLVRNAVDHGLEPPEERTSAGKPSVGILSLEASHSGNNVSICVRDDGRGINADKIKAKLVDQGLLSAADAADLSDEQALGYIWHPGFSTSATLTDVSGRGVGMDVVKTRIQALKGDVTVTSTPRRGTTFKLRLPLTLAIINSLLVRIRTVTFSIPIDAVREIVLIDERDVIRVSGRRTCEMRGTLVPLVQITDVFQWHRIHDHDACAEEISTGVAPGQFQVVMLQAGGRTMGLPVDELLGSQDLVVKSLADNFVDIRGLSGASILGDGSVCLMLDAGAWMQLAGRMPPRWEDVG